METWVYRKIFSGKGEYFKIFAFISFHFFQSDHFPVMTLYHGCSNAYDSDIKVRGEASTAIAPSSTRDALS